jgi:hypothetical protein
MVAVSIIAILRAEHVLKLSAKREAIATTTTYTTTTTTTTTTTSGACNRHNCIHNHNLLQQLFWVHCKPRSSVPATETSHTCYTHTHHHRVSQTHACYKHITHCHTSHTHTVTRHTLVREPFACRERHVVGAQRVNDEWNLVCAGKQLGKSLGCHVNRATIEK